MDRFKRSYTVSRSDIKNNLRMMRKIRFVSGFVIFMFFGYMRLIDWLHFPFFLFAVGPVFEMFINQPYEWLIKKVKNHQLMFFAMQVLDVIAVTWSVYFVGVINTIPAVLVYPLIFVFTAMVFTRLRTYIMANFCFLLFAVVYFLEDRGVVPRFAHTCLISGQAKVIFVVFTGFMYNLMAFTVTYVTLILRRREQELEERVKELNCLYELSRITDKNRDSSEKVMRDIVRFIPEAFRHTEWACARILYKGKEFKTDNFRETEWRGAEDIRQYGDKVGVIEVFYLKELPAVDEGPFLREELVLLEIMAERLGKIAERVHAQKELEEYSLELQRSNKDLSDFAYIISHDLKEPLRNIDAFTRFASEDCAAKLDDEGKKNLERIRANVTRMGLLIDNLLELSRLVRQKNQLENVRVDDAIKEALLGCEYSIRMSKAEISVEEKMPVIFCDRVRLVEVFTNLISNAIKFRRDEPLRIEIGCRKDGLKYEFYVKDNGQGIEEHDIDKIFSMFTRVGVEKDQRGSGIGLTIVKRIVEMYGGTIRVESQVGVGTTFYFTLA
jgi:signal transduction histidine kinase